MKKQTLLIQTAADLKKARRDAGFTMQSLADKMGVTRVTITRLESGKENMTLETIERLSKAIGVKVKVLFIAQKSPL